MRCILSAQKVSTLALALLYMYMVKPLLKCFKTHFDTLDSALQSQVLSEILIFHFLE